MLPKPRQHAPAYVHARRALSAAASIVLRAPALLLGPLAATITVSGCTTLYDPALETRPYPSELGQGGVVQVQAIPMELAIRVINATATDYSDIDVWVNRRYVQHVRSIPAGATVDLEIEKFRDQWGQCPQPGGFWRTRAPTPLVLVQIQTDEKSPLVGLVMVVPEAARY
jgi:hypothetical protein